MEKNDNNIQLNFDDLPQEIWRDVAGYEGLYQISNYGRVKSFQRGKEKIRVPRLNRSGYLRVNLSKDGQTKTFSIHGLVAKAFIPNPDNKPQINHICGDKTINSVWNLEWATAKENKEHAKSLGLIGACRGTESSCAKLTEEQIRYIRKYYKPYNRQFGARALGKKFNVCSEVIYNVAHNKTYKNII